MKKAKAAKPEEKKEEEKEEAKEEPTPAPLSEVDPAIVNEPAAIAATGTPIAAAA